MNANDLEALERLLPAWLHEHAPTPPPGLLRRVLNQSAARPQRRGWDWSRLAIGAVAATVVVVAIVVGLQLGRLAPDEQRVGATPVPVETGSTPATPTPPAETASPPPTETSTPAPGAAAGRIAFSSNRGGASFDIYTMAPDGSDVRQLTTDPTTAEIDPRWSPDGRYLSYTVITDSASFRGGVMLVDADGTNPRQVSGEFQYGIPTWSPDGAFLALGGSGEPGTGIAIYSVANDQLIQLTNDGGIDPLWSPLGDVIAYTAANDVWLVVTRGVSGEPRALTDDAQAFNDHALRWTADQEHVLFSSDRNTDRTKGSDRLWSIASGGSGEPELVGPLRREVHSRDGDWVAYVDDAGVHLASSDGSAERLVRPGPAVTLPSWAADSSAFVFAVIGADEGLDIFLMEVDAESAVPLLDDPANDGSPDWQRVP